MTENKSLGEILSGITVEHGITIDKLSELTNIPKRYLSAMAENNLNNMPAAPYVKGYIVKICATLGIDPLPVMEAYKETGLKTSGKDDCLPKNRFTLAKNKKIWLIATVILVLVLIIGFLPITRYVFASFIGIPSIEVNLPEKMEDRDFLETRKDLLTIEGKINPKDSIIINKEPVSVSTDGRFTKDVLLDAGLNTFEIKVKRFLGRETNIIRKVFYITENLNEETNSINYGEETAE
ncbi:MAG: helix-turn-helix domain-containing protein [Parcubacteria group bacterium]